MKAARLHALGQPLVVEEAPRPEPLAGEVLAAHFEQVARVEQARLERPVRAGELRDLRAELFLVRCGHDVLPCMY